MQHSILFVVQLHIWIAFTTLLAKQGFLVAVD